MGRIKKEFILDNLNCAHCAGNIEKKINSLNKVAEVNFDFVSKRLVVYGEENNLIHIYGDIKKIVAKTDSSIKVIEKYNYINNYEEDNKNKEKFFRFVFGSLLFLVAAFIKFSGYINFLFYVATFLVVGYEVLIKSIKNILGGNIFDENFLMSIATVGAFLIGDCTEGAAVMLFYTAGEMFQDMSVNSSRKEIKKLLDIKAEYANLLIGDVTKKVSPEEINVGDIILVKPGERVPLDGIIIDGKAIVDTSAITGEALPKSKKEKDEILSGFINLNGVLKVKVNKSLEDSTVSKIMELIENASIKKAKTENFITKFSKIYTPVIVLISIFIAIIPPVFLNESIYLWIYKALAFLVVSCPCALVISIPLSFFGGIGAASKNGILIKGSNYLEALNSIDTIIFDKTGTLTEGKFEVIKVEPLMNYSEEEILEIAATVEYFSNHVIAKSIVKANNKDVDKNVITNYEELSGLGIKAKYKSMQIYIGNKKLMEKFNINCKAYDEKGTTVYLAIKDQLVGIILIDDILKKDSKKTIEDLENLGVSNIIILSGDNSFATEAVAKRLGIKNAYSQLLPSDKVNILEKVMKNKKKNVFFVGDGINDAPVLMRADVGISMGALGADVAVEASDIVLMVDEPSKIITAIKIARFTRKIVSENIIFALGVKIAVLVLVFLGFSTMWEAIFADVGVTLLAVFNAMRASRVYYG